MSDEGAPSSKWTELVCAPDDLDEGVDEFGNPVVGKWMLSDLTPALWEAIQAATIEGYLGVGSKVLEDFSRACVYTRDYRDREDLRRVLGVLRRLGMQGWVSYKRDCDTMRSLYGPGAAYWTSPPGTTDIRLPARSIGRELDGAGNPGGITPV